MFYLVLASSVCLSAGPDGDTVTAANKRTLTGVTKGVEVLKYVEEHDDLTQ
jgi:hypothetical protein